MKGTETFWQKAGRVTAIWILPVLLSGVVREIGLFMFVKPNEFAPGGINGLAVLLEYATHISMGWFLLALNVPLFFIAFFLLGKREAILSTASMLLTSGLDIVMQEIPALSALHYRPENGILAAIAGGIFLGVALAIMLKSCGTAGGTAVLASLVNKKFRAVSVSWGTFFFDATVVVASFFVYNPGGEFTLKLTPVLLALVSLFVTSKTCDVILQGLKVAYKFEIITEDPETIAKEIMETTHHGVTEVPAIGMYSHAGKDILVCIVRKRHIAELQRIIKKYPGTFAYFSQTSEVFGKFLK